MKSGRASIIKFYRAACLVSFLCALSLTVAAQVEPRRTSIAVLDFGETETAHRASGELMRAFVSNLMFSLNDRDEARAAARGAGYTGSLNMTLAEARDLGAAIGCDFFLTGDAQTIRRSSSARPVYYEAYASIFIVSARTGKLVRWDRPSFEAATPEESEKLLLAELVHRAALYSDAIHKAQADESKARALTLEHSAPVIEEAPDEGSPAAQGFRAPEPFRRLRPAYPETAARAEAEATVDVLVDIDTAGEVSGVEVVRWAGFGLDDAAVQTVRQLHFRPAMRDGVPIPMRVLLRYNFRRPQK